MHRLYSNDEISVFWDSDKCFHSKKCVTGCPDAFDITRKPWINIDDAPTAKVWKAVSACPSGALTITYNHDVKIRFEEDKIIADVIINVSYGNNVMQVAKNVQDKLLSVILDTTGFEKAEVNVHVSGISFDK